MTPKCPVNLRKCTEVCRNGLAGYRLEEITISVAHKLECLWRYMLSYIATFFTIAELGIQVGTHSHWPGMVEFGRQALTQSSFKKQKVLSDGSKTRITGHRSLFDQYWDSPSPFVMLILGLSTTLRQRLGLNITLRQCWGLRLVLISRGFRLFQYWQSNDPWAVFYTQQDFSKITAYCAILRNK